MIYPIPQHKLTTGKRAGQKQGLKKQSDPEAGRSLPW